ncbi:FAD/NAD(P)-binding domain-containing protein [Glonium stellatum]|uniref:FAD/NAD(P)-binding domain-containing protein n=1 Tax=Glonium stellatum TaxID=574774 RepID=A0A8E2FB36_9PEZI|nr:FAD/NAD(P)-binding domain-containing protein [Glonium stellatum]
MSAEDKQEADLIIIGSGIYGIQAARTYLEVHPDDCVIILEASSCPGGVWSEERMYDVFWTQTPLQTTEFSDQPLTNVSWNETYHGYFPAKYFTAYLSDYLKCHAYNGLSLMDRIIFNASVRRLQKEGWKWVAKIENSDSTYTAPKVIDASGHTTIPSLPEIPGAETFKGLSLHQKKFGKSDILSDSRYQHITVIGGAKSAADVAYAAAKAGKSVSWIIRKSGSGPAAYAPPTAPVKLYRNSNEAFHHRLMGTLCASVFSEQSWWSRFIYRTRIGNWILRGLWNTMQADGEKIANFNRADGKNNGFANLKPDTTVFWQNDSSGVLQRKDFFDVIASHVQVFRQDITHIGGHEVFLANKTSVNTDVIVYATGWKHLSPYIDDRTASELGLTIPKPTEDSQKAAKWRELDQRANNKILKRFPILSKPPPHYQHGQKEAPFRLYKSIIPVHDHSIAFIGKLMIGNHCYNAEVQALYAVAVLDHKIALPSEEHMEEEIASVVAWCKRRYLTKGIAANWFYWDLVPYTDALLKELGLSSHRKKGWKDLLAPALAPDLKGLINEYTQRNTDARAKKSK